MNKKMYSIIFLFIFSSGCYSDTIYLCPKVPIKMKEGELLSHHWFSWPLNEEINDERKSYYQLHSKQYRFNYWAAFPSGVSSGKPSKNKYFIACCGWIEYKQQFLCAYKHIQEKNCKESIKKGKRDRFICKDNN